MGDDVEGLRFIGELIESIGHGLHGWHKISEMDPSVFEDCKIAVFIIIFILVVGAIIRDPDLKSNSH